MLLAWIQHHRKRLTGHLDLKLSRSLFFPQQKLTIRLYKTDLTYAWLGWLHYTLSIPVAHSLNTFGETSPFKPCWRRKHQELLCKMKPLFVNNKINNIYTDRKGQYWKWVKSIYNPHSCYVFKRDIYYTPLLCSATKRLSAKCSYSSVVCAFQIYFPEYLLIYLSQLISSYTVIGEAVRCHSVAHLICIRNNVQITILRVNWTLRVYH